MVIALYTDDTIFIYQHFTIFRYAAVYVYIDNTDLFLKCETFSNQNFKKKRERVGEI